VIDVTTEVMVVVPLLILQMVLGYVNYLPHILVKGCPPLLTRWTPVTLTEAHELALWNAESHDWISTDYIINYVPCPSTFDNTIHVYLYDFMDVLHYGCLYTVLIHWQNLNCNQCRHFCSSSSLPLFIAAALWRHHSELTINQLLWCEECGTVRCRGKAPRLNVQCWVDCTVFFGTPVVVLCKSWDIKIDQDAGGVNDAECSGIGGVGMMKQYRYSSFRDFSIQLSKYYNYHSYPACVSQQTQHYTAYRCCSFQSRHGREASRWDWIVELRNASDQRHCFSIKINFTRSNFGDLTSIWVVLRMVHLWNHSNQLPMFGVIP